MNTYLSGYKVMVSQAVNVNNMRFNLDLDIHQLRALYIAIAHRDTFECLEPVVDKLDRFLEIAKTADK